MDGAEAPTAGPSVSTQGLTEEAQNTHGNAQQRGGAPLAADTTQQQTGVTPEIQNIVATTHLGMKIDLKNLAMYAFNAEYNPQKFAACILRMREPRTTALVFASGKMVCTGAKDETQARMACRKYARMIQKVGHEHVKFKEFRIQNIVGKADTKFPVRLEGLAIAHQQFSQYEPELFPGLVYRMQHPRVVILVFVSGKLVLTGAKTKQDIDRAFEQIYPVLYEFRKLDDASNSSRPAKRQATSNA